MSTKYPEAGDIYQSRSQPGNRCMVVSIVEAQVTFKWRPPYSYIDEQVVPVSKFIRDFDLCVLNHQDDAP